MNMDERNETIDALTAQLDELNAQLEDAKEQRNELLRQRFDLKEQRRYFRAQLREAASPERVEQINDRLGELEEKLHEIDEKIESLESVIEETGNQAESIADELSNAAADKQTEHGAEDNSDKWEKTMENFNQILQKGLKKVADTLEHVDFETIGQDVQSAVSKAAKTVGNAATGAAKGVGNMWNEAREKSQKPGGIGDYRISGSGVLDGGCYNRITTSGSCKVSSDLICRTLRSSGSFRACGNIDCANEIHSSGAFHCDGNVDTGGMNASGSVKIMGNLKSGLVNIPGSLKVDGNISAGEMRVSGSLKTGGDCEADSFTASGSFTVGGIINAETISIRLDRAQSTVGSIGGTQVTIAQSPAAGFLSGIVKPGYGILTCDSIEGDQVELTGVRAETVRGANVVIHGGCIITRVEYSGACSIDDSAQVGECVKI